MIRAFPNACRLCAALCMLWAGAGFAGCTLGEPYSRPALELPEKWRTDISEMRRTARPEWWEIFGDPALSAALEQALRANHELLASGAGVDAFAARFAAAYSEEFPNIDLSTSVTRSRRSLSGLTSGLIPGSRTSTSGDISLRARWELDLWGRLENATNAARAQLLEQESMRRGVVLSLVASVASAYVRMRQADQLLDIARNTVTSRRDALKLTQSRFNSGMTPELDVRQAESELATAETTVPRFERQAAQNANLLRALQGLVPGDVPRGRPLPELAGINEIPAELPSQLLDDRPDIRAAEERLAAAHAELNVARAAYFPTISLTALADYSSGELDSWLEGRSRTWSLGPSLAVPLFTAGRIGHEIDAADAEKRRALESYRETVVQALREVEDALVAYRTLCRESETRVGQLSALRSYLKLAEIRYDGGQSSYLDVLDAQRALFEGELNLAQTQGDVALALIQIYRVLGGGWTAAVAPGRELPPAAPKIVPRFSEPIFSDG